MYEANKEYKEIKDLHKQCEFYAMAYTEVMLNRAKADDPEIFAMRGMCKEEMQTYLV